MKRYVFAITGASGPAIAIRALAEIVKQADVHLIMSRHAAGILKEETGIDFSGDAQKAIRAHFKSDNIIVHDEHDMAAPVSSGSFRTDGMFIVPCSMKTLAAVANGLADNLIARAADVTIKEGRPLLIAPREMPFSAIHLENMLKLSRLGVKIAPPVAAFYHRPQSLDQMIDFFAGKILSAMGVEHELFKPWEGRG